MKLEFHVRDCVRRKEPWQQQSGRAHFYACSMWTEAAVKSLRAEVARLLRRTLIPPFSRLSLAQKKEKRKKKEKKRSHVSESGDDEQEGNARGVAYQLATPRGGIFLKSLLMRRWSAMKRVRRVCISIVSNTMDSSTALSVAQHGGRTHSIIGFTSCLRAAHVQICAAILVGLWYLHFWYCIAIQLSGIQSRVLTLTLTPDLWPRSYIYNIATKQRGPEITQTAE